MTLPFVRVALPRPVEETFHYRVPAGLAGKIVPGSVVVVPFGRRTLTGVVVEAVGSSPVDARPVMALADTPPVAPRLLELARWVSAYYMTPLGMTLRMALPPAAADGGARFGLTESGREAAESSTGTMGELLRALARGSRTTSGLQKSVDLAVLEEALAAGLVKEETGPSPPPAGRRVPTGYRREEAAVERLTSHQRAALDSIRGSLAEGSFTVTLLQGVTGSGKTEVYLRAARQVIESGRSVLVLVPEISLTPLLTARFASVAGDRVAVLHSAFTAAERRASWRAVSEGSARLAVGVRSGVFAPVRDLGLIIVDEEHDPSFRQEDTPSYSARDVAIKRGQIEGVPVLLGSATPSLETYTNALAGRYRLAVLPERVTPSPHPEMVVADLSDPAERLPDNPFLSVTLLDALRSALGEGEQALLFLNRRGYAPFLLCQECRHTLPCPSCSVTLTFHRRRGMVCHYCGHRQDPPSLCPSCGGVRLMPVGMGTQRLEETLASLFPEAVVERLDRDAMERRGALDEIYRRMDEGKISMLVGTQVIAKGHDFPNVTLVGILNAEQALDFPDFRSPERAFSLITQVAGRAGRGKRPGKVVVQSFAPGHYAVTAALAQDYEAFYRAESEARRQLGYPPFGRMGRVLVDGTVEKRVQDAVAAIAGKLRGRKGLRVLGPAPAPLSRLKARHRWHILLFAPTHSVLHRALSAVRGAEHTGVRVHVRVDPQQLL